VSVLREVARFTAAVCFVSTSFLGHGCGSGAKRDKAAAHVESRDAVAATTDDNSVEYVTSCWERAKIGEAELRAGVKPCGLVAYQELLKEDYDLPFVLKATDEEISKAVSRFVVHYNIFCEDEDKYWQHTELSGGNGEYHGAVQCDDYDYTTLGHPVLKFYFLGLDEADRVLCENGSRESWYASRVVTPEEFALEEQQTGFREVLSQQNCLWPCPRGQQCESGVHDWGEWREKVLPTLKYDRLRPWPADFND